MPNWSAANYVLRGPRKDIQRFCDTVNSCYDKPDAIEDNDFGKLWLGNVCAAFGYDWTAVEKTHNIRGLLDPDPESEACFCGPMPDPDNPRLVPEHVSNSMDVWQIAFSTQTAWDRSQWLDDLFDNAFPECKYGWKSTDEFGNFHKTYHPGLIGAPSIEIEVHENGDIKDLVYAWGEENQAAATLTELTGIPVTADEIEHCDERFCKTVNDWNEAHEDNEIYVTAWDIVTD